MNSSELDEIVSRVPKLRETYLGTFASNELVIPDRYPASFIVNLDESDEIGTHWVAGYCKRAGRIDYFDPLGLPPSGNILKFITHNFTHIFYSQLTLQDKISSACGSFCLCYLIYATQNIAFEKIMQKFDSIADNDQAVVSFINRTFNKTFKVFDFPSSLV
jgi:hypothetical protein